EIKKVMQQSSRIFSLSGWSGIWAGIVALIGTWWFWFIKNHYTTTEGFHSFSFPGAENLSATEFEALQYQMLAFHLDETQKMLLLWSALVIFSVAVIGAVFFSYRKNMKNGF